MKIQLSLLWCVSLATLAAAPVLHVDLSVARADVLLARLPAGDPWEKTPDGSTLAWGESHLLHALVDLYEATGEAKYLAEVARRDAYYRKADGSAATAIVMRRGL